MEEKDGEKFSVINGGSMKEPLCPPHPFLFLLLFLFFLLLFVIFETASLYSFCCPRTQSVDQASNLIHLPLPPKCGN